MPKTFMQTMQPRHSDNATLTHSPSPAALCSPHPLTGAHARKKIYSFPSQYFFCSAVALLSVWKLECFTLMYRCFGAPTVTLSWCSSRIYYHFFHSHPGINNFHKRAPLLCHLPRLVSFMKQRTKVLYFVSAVTLAPAVYPIYHATCISDFT